MYLVHTHLDDPTSDYVMTFALTRGDARSEAGAMRREQQPEYGIEIQRVPLAQALTWIGRKPAADTPLVAYLTYVHQYATPLLASRVESLLARLFRDYALGHGLRTAERRAQAYQEGE